MSRDLIDNNNEDAIRVQLYSDRSGDGDAIETRLGFWALGGSNSTEHHGSIATLAEMRRRYLYQGIARYCQLAYGVLGCA